MKRPRWEPEHLEAQRRYSIERFREERMREPLEAYLWVFERYRAAAENLLELTADLSALRDVAVDVLADPALQEAARYLAGPPISADDLKILAEASLTGSRLRKDSEMALRIIDTVLEGLDRNRFPWIADGRDPTEAERQASVLASATLMAAQRIRTARANESKGVQEQEVADLLLNEGFTEIPARQISTLGDAPGRSEFCKEALFGSRKADLIVRLWDGRVMPCEISTFSSARACLKGTDLLVITFASFVNAGSALLPVA